MSLKLYFDVHVRSSIRNGLRKAGIDVITAQLDGTAELPDRQLLDRATELGRVLFTHDKDFLQEAAQRQNSGIPFAGLVYARQGGASIGQYIGDLRLLAEVYDSHEMENRVEYLPLK